MFSTEQDFDGEAFRELSSCDDIEDELQCTFTLGGKRKLEKVLASIQVLGPSGMFATNFDDNILILVSIFR